MLETPIIQKKKHTIMNYKKVRQFIVWQRLKKMIQRVFYLLI